MVKQLYVDPVLQVILDLLKKEMDSAYVKTWQQGDILLLPKTLLPAVSIARDNTAIMANSNLEDHAEIPVVLSILVDHTDAAGLQKWDIAAGQLKLYEMTAGMHWADKDAVKKMEYLEGCMAYVLMNRQNQDLGNGIYLNIQNNSLLFDYGIGIERRGAGIFSIEASCQFIVTVTTEAIRPYGVIR